MRAARRLDAPPLGRLLRIGGQPGEGPLAVEAARLVQAAVQVDDARAAGALVQVVDVLGDQGETRHVAGQFGDGEMRRIGLRPEYP
ncbi:hypothetical protein D3C78_1512530 [compost metagenome]